MNRVYRVIWSKARRVWIVASELASPHRKGGSVGSAAVGSVPNRTAWVRRSLCAGLLGAIWAAGGPAVADELYWDTNETGVGLGGTGTWDLTNSFWDGAGDGVTGPYVNWDNLALDDAIFTGTAGTVTLAAPVTVQSLSFLAHNYVLNGSTLTLGGATPTINAQGNTTIGSVIAGTSGLTKTGGGSLRLSGINTFSGGIALDGGSLYAASDAALGALTNDITTAAGVTVRLSILGTVDTNRSVTIGGLLILEGARAGSALITGNGNLQVGTNDVIMSNDANTYTGTTTFRGCTGVCESYFTSIADLGQASALGAPTTVANGTILFAQSSQYSDSLIYIGSGHSSNRNWSLQGAAAILRNRGSGTLTLTGDITSNGGAVFSAEDADFELLGELSGPADFSFSGNAGSTITLGGSNSYSGTTAIDGVTVVAPVLADGGMNSSFGAGASITLNDLAAVSYTGEGGSSDRTWTSEGSTAIRNDGTGALTLSGPLAFQAGDSADVLTLGGSYGGENTFSGVIDGIGDLVSDGSGTWVLDGANTRGGALRVESGTLRAGNADAFGVTTSVTVNGGTLDLNDIDFEFLSLAGSGGTLALGSAGLTLNAAAGSNSYAGDISGTGALTKLGLSTQTLSGANTYTGATTVGGGTLALDFAAAGGPVSDIVSGVSTLNMGGGRLTVTGAAGENNTQTFDGLNITAGSNRIATTSGAGGTMTVNFGTITRTGGLVDFALPASGNFTTSSTSLGGWATVNGTDYAKVDGGNIVAFTATDYSNKDDAATWLSGDVVSDVSDPANTAFFGTVSGSPQLDGLKYTAAADSTVNIATGETLSVDGTIIVASSVDSANQTIDGGSLTGGAGGSTLGILQNGEGNFTIASTIVDNGGLTGFTKGGSGLASLTGVNSYTGATTLSGGTLAFNSIANGGTDSAIGASTADASNLVLESGTLRYDGTTAATDRGFTLVNGGAARTIEVASAGTNLTFGGQVTSPDDAGFTKAGAGTLTLANGSNDYTGVTTVSDGTLAVSTLANGGAASSIGVSSSDAANLVLAGGTLNYLGGTASSDRGFTLGAGDGGFGVAAAGTTLTMTGTAVGAGGLHKEGDGTLVLTGANTYTGDTFVNGGTLRAGSSQAFGAANNRMTVNGGGTLDLDGFDISAAVLIGGGTVDLGSATLTTAGGSATFTGKITGTGGFTRGSNGGVQTMNGCQNDYTGVTTIDGTLRIDCLADGGAASGIGASNSDAANLNFITGALDYTGGSVVTDRGFTLQSGWSSIDVTNAATTLEFGGQVAGVGGLTKGGAGTLVLSGVNTYTGATRIADGTLRAGSSQAFGSPDAMILANGTGAILDLAGYDTSVAYLETGTGGTVNLGGATLTIATGKNSATSYFAGAIDGTGALIKNGNSLQNLTGCGSSYTGSTTINGGVLAVACLADGGVASSIGSSGADASNLVLNGGTLRYIGTGGSTDRQFTLGASADSALAASGTGAIEFTSAAPVTFAVADSAQTLTLTGTNSDDNIFAAQITDNGTGVTSLAKSDSGTWILTNPDSSYTGTTTILGGVLGVDKLSDGGVTSSIGASTADASSLVIGNGSTLRYTGSGDSTDRLFTLAEGVSFIESSGTGALQFTNTASATLAGSGARTIALGGTNTGLNIMGGAIADASASGATTLAKNDGGTWVLTGNNTYTGNTVINDGNLIVGNGGTTGNVGDGNVIVDAATSTLSINRSDTVDLNGTLSGPGSFAQIGTGTTRLTSPGNSIGGTTVSAGTLEIAGELASATIALNGTSTLNVVGTVEGDGGAAVFAGDGGASTINVDATGTLIASGDLGDGSDAVNISGALDTGAASLSLGDGDDVLTFNDGASIAGPGIAAAGGANDRLVLNNALALTFASGTITGFEQLSKENDGTATLTGSHGFSGGTTIDGGTLAVDGTLETPAITVADDTTLTVDGTAQAAGGTQTVITGTTGINAVRVNDGATLRASGDLGDGSDVLDVIGTLDTGAGTFALGGGDDVFALHDGSTVVGTVDGGAGMDTRLYDIDLTANVGVLAGFEGLTKTGSGTLNLNGPGNSTLAEVDVQDGTLNVGAAGGIDGAQETTVASGAILNVDSSYTGTAGDDAFTVAGTVAGPGNVDIGGGDDTLTLEDGAVLHAAIYGGGATAGDSLVLDIAASLTLDGTSVGGFEALTKQDTGIATLTGAHFYDSTSVDAGTLDVDGTLETGSLALADGGILNVNGTVQAAGALPASFSGTAGVNTIVVTSGGTLLAAGDFGDGNDVLDLAGTLDTGAGIFSLGTGDDEFVVHDSTEVIGTLDAGAGNDLLNVNVSSGEEVQLGSTTGFESLGKSGLGALEINGASEFADVQVQAGLLDVTATGSIEAPTATVSAGATLNIDGSFNFTTGLDTFTVAGMVTGIGTIDMQGGDDELVLQDGANLTGFASVVQGGAGGDTVVLDNAAAFSIDGSTITGFEQLVKQNMGTATLTGTHGYDSTAIDAGTLAVDGALESTSLTLADDTTLNVDGQVQAAGATQVAVTGSTGVNNVIVGAGATLIADGDLGDGNDMLDVGGTLDIGGGAFNLGSGDDIFVVRDGTNVVGTVIGGAGFDSRLYDITGTANVGALQEFEGLTKRNVGTLEITGPATTDLLEVGVEGGTLNVAAAADIVGVETATVEAGATLQVDGGFRFTAGVDTLTVAGVVAGAGTIDMLEGDDQFVVTDGADLSQFENAIDGGLGSDTLTANIATSATLGGATNFETLIKQGAGIFGITGPAESLFDTVLVEAGELEVSADAIVDPHTTVIDAPATLTVEGAYLGTADADTLLLAGTLAGAGTIDLLGDDDVLTIENGAGIAFTGLFDAAAGTDDFVLAGDAGSDTLDMGLVGTVFENFEAFRKEGSGTWRLSGTGDRDWTVAAGTLTGDSESFGGDIANEATVVFDQAVDGEFAGVLTGGGSLVKDNVGTLALTSVNTFSGDTAIAAGTLQVDGVLPGALSIAPGATLSGIGTVGNVTAPADAWVVPGNPANPFGTLTISGNYAGGGTVALNTVLGDDSSETSRLVVEGNTGGASAIVVTNAGGTGAQTTGDGIELVQVDGASPADSFQLGQPVQAGAYEYLLYQGSASDDNDWYLRSDLIGEEPPDDPDPVDPVDPPTAYRPGVAGYTLGHQLDLELGFTALGSLRARVGDQGRVLDAGHNRPADAWMRVYAHGLEVEGSRFGADDVQMKMLQFGTDIGSTDTGPVGTHLGVMVSVVESSATFVDPEREAAGLSEDTGTVRTDVKGGGIYWTRFAESGAYLDLSAQYLHYSSRYRDQYQVAGQQDGWGTTVGAEAGVPFALGETKWNLEPNARLAWQRLELDGFADGVSEVAAVDADGVRARAGVELFRTPGRWLGMEDASPYIAFGVQRDFRDAASVAIGGSVLRDDIPDTTGDVSLGFTGSVQPNVELHLDLRYQEATDGTRDGMRANFGFRIRF